ncbi:putative WD repeat-containing protein [Escovopsis weberi]|uniref:Putative WD repeat-containing protein n=1 Tax=Escovopsis weberi TaxID=150374 RepID=A0A0N0RTU8_ESCWE|nr:putative WD repeat-containing protein [Escovopsis weberi]
MASNPHQDDMDHDNLLDAEDVAEEILQGEDDVAMDSDGDDELVLQNDSIAYFDLPQDSLFAIAQHPQHPNIIAVGGSAGQEDNAPGAGWLFDTSAARSRPVLPASYASDPAASAPSNTQLESTATIDGHTDSINTLAWTLPRGEVLLSGGLDGRIRAWRLESAERGGLALLGEAQEVEEVNWIAPCPSPAYPDTFALGASNGSVWVYTVDRADAADPLQIVQSYFLHTASCTGGAWTADGQLLATISEDSSLYVWDVWGAAAAANITGDNGQSVVSLTGEDQRFEVPGGLYSLAVDPKGAFVAVGGAGGQIRVVSLPRLVAPGQPGSSSSKKGKGGAGGNDPSAGGQILASLQTQADSVETLAVAVTSSTPPTTLLAAGSVDGSICVYDASRRFAVRKNLVGAHEDHSVVKVEFVPGTWLLTSCGMDGVVRRWNLRASGATGASAAESGLLKELKGHMGGGEGGGVLGFVQGKTGEMIVTAGDDGVSLVFEA